MARLLHTAAGTSEEDHMSIDSRLVLSATAALVCLLSTACGGDDSTSSGGGSSSSSSASQPSQAQQTKDQFCSDLGSLNIAVITMETSSPASFAINQNSITTSYQSVRREAASVPNVQPAPLDNAYNAYNQAAQALGPAPQSLASLQPSLQSLQGATAATGTQAQCAPLATPVVSSTPASRP